MRSLRVFSLAILLLISTAALAQLTTGNLTGTAVDNQGASLPGVTVTLMSSPPQVQVTNAEGEFRFFSLPPATYTIKAQLEGFGSTQQPVTVNLGRTTSTVITMSPAIQEDITVTAEAPLLATRSASIDTNLGAVAIETLPTGRNYSSIAQVVPGVASDANPGNKDQNTITVYGSSGAENAYYVDGVNTTNLEYGFQGKELNFEFIREVNVKTGGYEAEFGRATGGIVNVITKSGGNELSGDVGGFIVHDKLWFFAAYDRVQNSIDNILPEGPRAGSIETSDSARDLGSAKLTYNAAAGQSLVFTFLQDPRIDTGAINDASHTLIGDPSTYLGRQDFGGHDYALRYDGVIGSAWV